MFFQSEDPATLFELQVRLAREIRASEPLDGEDEGWHRRRLRNIGDAIAWRTLTPHAIRNLSVPGTKPPALSGQGAAFDHVLETGRLASGKGMAVIIADVTNCISTGDLAICGDPDAPYIVECKLSARSPSTWMQGRRGRQFSRAKAVGTYLDKGRGLVPGTPMEKFAVEVAVEAEHNWEHINAAVLSALSAGTGLVRLDQEIIWAKRPDDDAEARLGIADIFPRGTPVLIGCHSALLTDDAPHAHPPLTWQVDRGVAVALAELDIVVCHALDSRIFSKFITERARLGDVVEVAPGVSGVAATVDGKPTVLGPRFLVDVLYGFETVASGANHMLKALEASNDAFRGSDVEPPKDPATASKPKVHHLETREGLERFRAASEAGVIADNDVIVFGPALARELGIEGKVPRRGSVVVVSPPSKKE
jgi:hypothetical protein